MSHSKWSYLLCRFIPSWLRLCTSGSGHTRCVVIPETKRRERESERRRLCVSLVISGSCHDLRAPHLTGASSNSRSAKRRQRAVVESRHERPEPCRRLIVYGSVCACSPRVEVEISPSARIFPLGSFLLLVALPTRSGINYATSKVVASTGHVYAFRRPAGAPSDTYALANELHSCFYRLHFDCSRFSHSARLRKKTVSEGGRKSAFRPSRI